MPATTEGSHDGDTNLSSVADDDSLKITFWSGCSTKEGKALGSLDTRSGVGVDAIAIFGTRVTSGLSEGLGEGDTSVAGVDEGEADGEGEEAGLGDGLGEGSGSGQLVVVMA